MLGEWVHLDNIMLEANVHLWMMCTLYRVGASECKVLISILESQHNQKYSIISVNVLSLRKAHV